MNPAITALVIVAITLLVLWFNSAGNDDELRRMTDEELQDEIELCWAQNLFSEDLEIEQLRRLGLTSK
jgi:hypothetical protein